MIAFGTDLSSRRRVRPCSRFGIPSLVWRESDRQRNGLLPASDRSSGYAVGQRGAQERAGRAECGCARACRSSARNAERSSGAQVHERPVAAARRRGVLAGPAPPRGLRRAAVPSGSPNAGFGVLATICVLFRMVEPPSPPGQFAEYFSLSLHDGAWLALISSLGMILGGVWPRIVSRHAGSARESDALWSGLSGWMPDA